MFKIIAPMKFLRGTVFDIFGYAQERKIERELICHYIEMILKAVGTMEADDCKHLVALAFQP